MDKSYEKLTPEHYKSELEPFIARKSSLSPISNPWLHWHESVEFLRCIEGSGNISTFRKDIHSNNVIQIVIFF